MDASVRKLFDRYQRSFNRALIGDIDMDDVASFYADAFIAASPAGVRAGSNDGQGASAIVQGYEHYRAIATKQMRIRQLRQSSVDEHHCVAHVAWTAVYAGGDGTDVAIDYDVHYLVQQREGQARIFGWIAGDEQALLRQHGII